MILSFSEWLASPYAAELTETLRAMHSEAALATLQSFDGDPAELGQKMLAHRARLDVVSAIELMHAQAQEDLREKED